MKQPRDLWQRLRALVPGSPKRTTPSFSEAQGALLASFQSLMEETRQLQAAMNARAKQSLEETRALDEDSLAESLQMKREELMRMRHSLDRTQISLLLTPRLMQEWEEWQQIAEVPGYHSTPEHDARREMVRSELIIRGVRLQTPRPAQQEPEELYVSEASSQTGPSLSEETQEIIGPAVLEMTDVDHLDEWRDFFGKEEIQTDCFQEVPQTLQAMMEAAQRARALKAQAGHHRLERRHARSAHR